MDFSAPIGRKKQRHGSALIGAGVTGYMSMTIPLYERDGLDFRPQDGKTSERQFAIIAFVIGCAAPGLYTNNHPVKTPNLNGGKFNVDTIYILLYMSAIFIRNSAYNFGYMMWAQNVKLMYHNIRR